MKIHPQPTNEQEINVDSTPLTDRLLATMSQMTEQSKILLLIDHARTLERQLEALNYSPYIVEYTRSNERELAEREEART